jgi:hypothetical protein
MPESIPNFTPRLSISTKMLYNEQERNIDDMKKVYETGYAGI